MSAFKAGDYWQKRLQANYTLGSTGWLGLGESYNRWMYRVRRHLFLKRVTPLVRGRSVDVLDVGSGTGFYVECWRQLGVKSITGVDITSVAVDGLRTLFPSHEFFQVDISGELGQLIARRFDVVSVMDVLYHVVDDAGYERAFANLATLLKPNGLLLLTENFLHRSKIVSAHQVQRTLVEIEDVIRRVGLVRVSRAPVFVLMNTPVDSRNQLHHIFWMVVRLLVARHEVIGNAIGACLYWPEIALASRLVEGPSTEMMICCKPA